MEQLMQPIAADLLRDERLLVVPKSLSTHLIRLITLLRQASIVAAAANDGDRDEHFALQVVKR
jgi:hypothetical protein